MAEKVSRIEGDYYYAGAVTFNNLTVPSGSSAAIGDAEIKSGAKVSASKLRRRMHKTYSQGNVAATTETKVLHVAYGAAGEALAVRVTEIARGVGAATVTFNVRKNGTTILTGVVTLDATHPAVATYGSVVGTIDPAQASYVAGDIFDVVITATAGGGTLPTGVAVDLMLDEDPN